MKKFKEAQWEITKTGQYLYTNDFTLDVKRNGRKWTGSIFFYSPNDQKNLIFEGTFKTAGGACNALTSVLKLIIKAVANNMVEDKLKAQNAEQCLSSTVIIA